ncbi:Aste57867_19369 [Aphanomyces stellatus]|uniref:Aste57867_19369 protein n=1 Tax=Aphanomyces stellatus TaxID=120398 RepID=A0A485LE26_9STRA|nr:hypothetical protein As57867_019305 [Aphanomyces stellatus]VFT96083.1 Aste57867_19369 [Aphanomyces stellatus]
MAEKAVVEWTTDDVVAWLHDVDLGAYERHFRDANVTGASLVTFSGEALTGMGVTSLKQRKEVLKHVHELQTKSPKERTRAPEDEGDAFDEEASHRSFVEALQMWRDACENPAAAHGPIDVGTDTFASRVCYQCFHTFAHAAHRVDGHDLCSSACEAAFGADNQREKLVSHALHESSKLQRQHIHKVWNLNVKF